MSSIEIEQALRIIAVSVIKESEIYISHNTGSMQLKTYYRNSDFDFDAASLNGNELSSVIIEAINTVNNEGDDKDFLRIISMWEKVKSAVDEKINQINEIY